MPGFLPTLLPSPCPRERGHLARPLVMALAWPCPALALSPAAKPHERAGSRGHRVCRAQLALSVTLICLQFRKPLKRTRENYRIPTYIKMRNNYVTAQLGIYKVPFSVNRGFSWVTTSRQLIHLLEAALDLFQFFLEAASCALLVARAPQPQQVQGSPRIRSQEQRHLHLPADSMGTPAATGEVLRPPATISRLDT